MTGKIIRLNDGGYGFIEQDGQTGDLFFHKSALVDVNFEDLNEGDKVNFEIQPVEEGKKGPSAINVTRV